MSAFSESPTAVPWKDPATQRASMIIVRTYWGRFLCIQRLAGVSRRSHSPPSVTKDTERLGSLCGSVTSNLGVWLWLYAFRQASQSPGWEIPILRAVVWEDWILNYSNTQVRQRLHLSSVWMICPFRMCWFSFGELWQSQHLLWTTCSLLVFFPLAETACTSQVSSLDPLNLWSGRWITPNPWDWPKPPTGLWLNKAMGPLVEFKEALMIRFTGS